MLILGFFTCGFHVTFIGLHLPNDLISKGISIDVAGWALAIIGLFNIVGTLFLVWLAAVDKHHVLPVLQFQCGIGNTEGKNIF